MEMQAVQLMRKDRCGGLHWKQEFLFLACVCTLVRNRWRKNIFGLEIRRLRMKDQNAITEPSVPPARASKRLSVSNCRTRRHRLAPIASPKRDFSLSHGSASKQKTGHVRAGNQQDKSKSGEHNGGDRNQETAFLGAREERRRMDCKRSGAPRSRVLLVNASCNHAQIRTHVLHRYAGPCSPKQSQPTHVVVRKPVAPRLKSLLHRDRHPERARNRLRAGESRSRNPNDGVGGLIEDDLLADQ
jgi:hypothetical protein